MKRKALLHSALCAIVLALGPGLAYAQTTPTLVSEATRMDQLATTQGESRVIDQISADFTSFLGGDSKAVVTGLRNGTPITLTTSSSAAPRTATTMTIHPPTGKMEFGNVFISLALARQQLSRLGITQPAPAELRAALLGGRITTGSGTAATTTAVQGILAMRSDGMGWGQIAQQMGVKLGGVVSGLRAANQGLAGQASAPARSGVVNVGAPGASGRGKGN